VAGACVFEQGGIITPARFPLIFIVSGSSGRRRHGYEDHWTDHIFLYYGEGQRGDMHFTKGNRALRDHTQDGKDIHLFEEVPKRDGFLQYRGQMVCTGAALDPAPDTTGTMRQAIIFEMTPLEQVDSAPSLKKCVTFLPLWGS
jgi:5-methylcytosine-specific restriction protein A